MRKSCRSCLWNRVGVPHTLGKKIGGPWKVARSSVTPKCKVNFCRVYFVQVRSPRGDGEILCRGRQGPGWLFLGWSHLTCLLLLPNHLQIIYNDIKPFVCIQTRDPCTLSSCPAGLTIGTTLSSCFPLTSLDFQWTEIQIVHREKFVITPCFI